MFQKVGLLEILGNRRVIKFLVGVLRIWENLLKELCDGAFLVNCNPTTYNLLHCIFLKFPKFLRQPETYLTKQLYLCPFLNED